MIHRDTVASTWLELALWIDWWMLLQQADGLTEEQQDEYREAWSLYDKSGGGALNVRQLGFVMRYLGQNPTDPEITDMITKYGSGMW